MKISSLETVDDDALESRVHDEHSIIGQIGNTPLLRIRNLACQNDRVEIYAKAEWFNPGGSVKDRAALNMLLEAKRLGKLTRDKTIIDATSGNTGIAYAMIGSALGYGVTIVIPSNAGEIRKQTLLSYGAEIILSDALEGTDGAQQRVKEIVAADPDRYYHPDQYNNTANRQAHYLTTAKEIWTQTRRRVTHFVAGLGTTGTFMGTARRLKELSPSIKCISFEPDSPLHGLEGLKHLPTAIVPGIYDPTLADEHLRVSTQEAFEMVKRLARQEGLLVGTSSGAAMAVCLKVAYRLPSGAIVTVFPDSGAKYMSDPTGRKSN